MSFRSHVFPLLNDVLNSLPFSIQLSLFVLRSGPASFSSIRHFDSVLKRSPTKEKQIRSRPNEYEALATKNSNTRHKILLSSLQTAKLKPLPIMFWVLARTQHPGFRSSFSHRLRSPLPSQPLRSPSDFSLRTLLHRLDLAVCHQTVPWRRGWGGVGVTRKRNFEDRCVRDVRRDVSSAGWGGDQRVGPTQVRRGHQLVLPPAKNAKPPPIASA